MRLRLALILFILALLIVIPLALARKPETLPRPAPVVLMPPLVPQVLPDAARPEPLRKPDVTRARRALGRCLQLMDFDVVEWDGAHLERLHAGASRPFREFTREFLTAAGSDPVGVTRRLLGECSSWAARFLLLSVLGEARRPASLSLLREFVDEYRLQETAIYSIGMARSQEGYEFLIEDLARERPGAVFGDDPMYFLRLQAIALHGARAIRFIEDRARTNKANFGVQAEDLLSWIRGSDAVPELTRLLETDENEGIRKGAARALGCNADPETLRYWLRRDRIEGAGWALAEPADRPDIWEPTAALRREIAERILPPDAAVTDDLDRTQELMLLGALCRPEKSRSFFDRVAATPESDPSSRTILVMWLFRAFADQASLSVERIERTAGVPVSKIDGNTWEEISLTWLPWKFLDSPPLEKELVELAVRSVDEESSASHMRFSMKAVRRELVWSTVLKEEAARMSTERRAILLKCLAEIDGTKPEGFLVSVLRDEPDPNIRLAAAAAYLKGSGPAEPDPTALRSIADLVARPEWLESRLLRFLPSVIGSYYSRYGTAADIPRLQQLPEDLSYPRHEESIRPYLESATLRAIDAIRLSAN